MIFGQIALLYLNIRLMEKYAELWVGRLIAIVPKKKDGFQSSHVVVV